MYSLINIRLDYCNSLLYGAQRAATVDKLQRAQNNAARAVLSANGRADARPVLRQLHWLPVRQRVFYKTALLLLLLLLSLFLLQFFTQNSQHLYASIGSF